MRTLTRTLGQQTREINLDEPVATNAMIQRNLAALEAKGFQRKRDDTLVFVASEPVEDRYEDVVLDSWELDNFANNPVFLDNHKSWELPIGKVIQNPIIDRQLVIEVLFDEKDEQAMKIKQKYDDEFLNAVSVGFMPGRRRWRDLLDDDHEWYLEGPSWGMLYEDNELLEVSAATIPALPSALQQREAPDREPEPTIEDFFQPEQGETASLESFFPLAPTPEPETLDALFQ